jgi:hypothetical protein
MTNRVTGGRTAAALVALPVRRSRRGLRTVFQIFDRRTHRLTTRRLDHDCEAPEDRCCPCWNAPALRGRHLRWFHELRRDRILESFSISRESATWSPDGKQLLGAGACGLIAIDLKSRKGRFGAGPASAWGWQPLLPAAPRAPAGSAMSTSSLCETS